MSCGARAAERGGARTGRPRWVRILDITAGSSIAAMIFSLAPQSGQWSMSILKAQRWRMTGSGRMPASTSGSFGAIQPRSLRTAADREI